MFLGAAAPERGPNVPLKLRNGELRYMAPALQTQRTQSCWLSVIRL